MDETSRPLKKPRLHEEDSQPGDNLIHQVHTSSFSGVNSGFQVEHNSGNITANFHAHSDHFETSENRNCLRALHQTDPRLDKRRIQKAKGGLLKEAYRWVFQNAEFQRWRYEEESQLLWVKGDPGKGKTMLLCGIIDELTKSSLSSGTTVIFFFCQAADARINHATGVLRGLISMLVDRHPSLTSHVRREYDRGGIDVFGDENAWYALLRIFTNILRDPLLRATYLIIDALDECTTGLNNLLDFIVEESALHPHVKWLVSSRNWPSIEQTLESATRKERLWLELNQASVSEAVGFYIHKQVDALTKKQKYSDEIRDAVLQHLLTNAHGTFLWVALICEELAKFDVPRMAFRRKLQEFPAGLDQLYQRMLNQIGDIEYSELCKAILGIITIVYRPITLDELVVYIELPRDVQFSDLDEIIGLCGSFLTLRGSTVSLVHQSAKDFLLRNAVDQILPRGEEVVHYEIFSKSLYAMANTLQRDTYDLSHPRYLIDQVKQPEPDPWAAVGYACFYWVDHLEMCSNQFCANISDDYAKGGAIMRSLAITTFIGLKPSA